MIYFPGCVGGRIYYQVRYWLSTFLAFSSTFWDQNRVISYLPFFLLLISTNVFVVTLMKIIICLKEFLFYSQYSHSTNCLKFIKGSTIGKISNITVLDFWDQQHLFSQIFFDISFWHLWRSYNVTKYGNMGIKITILISQFNISINYLSK